MRTTLITGLIVSCLVSCNKPNNAKLAEDGMTLMEASDCKTCHLSASKGIGPSRLEIAGKYDYTNDNVTLLAERIIKGSSGIWGDVPMTPHPDLSQEDAEKIVRYILSLDEEEPK